MILRAERKGDPPEGRPYLALLTEDVPGVVSLTRLPENRFYPAYPLLFEDLPFFLVNARAGREGIYAIAPGDDNPRLVVKCTGPDQVAVAANGSRIVFAASEVE